MESCKGDVTNGCRIVVTGAAGLVGHNLIPMLVNDLHAEVVAIDKHPRNLDLLARNTPSVQAITADLSEPGDWQRSFAGARGLVVLHAHITGVATDDFYRNNVIASRLVFETARSCDIPFTIHVSSSVVKSVVNDAYSATKRLQEKLFLESGLRGCVLRPTLMYGWFDPKHLGWLARLMRWAPIFPIPGHGRYARQPLYEQDFCRALLWCLERRPVGAVYDIVGSERIDYIDMMRAVRDANGLRTPIVRIPYGLFRLLLRLYAFVDRNPPFTAEQLDALTAGDDFEGVDIEATFGFKPTPFREGVRETFGHPVYSKCVVERG